MPNSKVFVSYLGDKNDYTNASPFGDLIYLTEGFVKLDNLAPLIKTINTKLNATNPETDSLLLVGNPYLCSIVLMTYLNRFGFARILHYDRRSTSLYRVLEVKTGDFFDLDSASDTLSS